MDDVVMAEQARRLRVEERLSARQIQQRLGVSKDKLQGWLRGVPPPEWTRRPNAKDELRARAIELRGDGWSVNDIALELGVARSTAFLWVRHLPLDRDSERARRKRAHSKLMTDARWAKHREERTQRRESIRAGTAAWLGSLSEREVLLLGAMSYWCEGAKSKPWRNQYDLDFINSDPVVVELFIRFVEILGVRRDQLTYRVSIHESADAEAAGLWWATQLGVPPERLLRPLLKRHSPVTNRHNTGDSYHGCLNVRVPRSQELYWWVEGVMNAFSESIGPLG